MIIYSFLNIFKCLSVAVFSIILTNELFNLYCNVKYLNLANSDLKDYKVVSSIWCNKDHGDASHKICLFENLCWLPLEEHFVIFIDEESVVGGVDSWHELSNIDFSSVEGHNRFLLKLAVINNPIGEKHPISRYRIHEEREWVYFVWRFKPDNIMHVFHDDLLPIYYTYKGICGGDIEHCINNYKLVFVDDIATAFSSDLYEIFSKEKSYLGDGGPVFLRDYWRNYSDSLICFKHARVGISRSTTWFQYGFGKPQGAIKTSNLTASVFRKFTQFLIQKMGLRTTGFHCNKKKFSPRALFLTRNISRKIINEEDVIETTKNVYLSVVGSSLSVKHFNPFSNSSLSGVREILKILTDLPPISFIFGMHGAALTVASFLGLAVDIGCNPLAIMELFPMGIDPDAVSPIKALTELPWLQTRVLYESWTNKDPQNSEIPSTYLHPLQGGGLACQGKDLRSTLRAVHCCHNEEYICRMFQDTTVDVEGEYLDKLRFLFMQQKQFKDSMATNLQKLKWFFPAPVRNISCKWNLKNLVLELQWMQPLNIHNQIHHYDITVILENEKMPEKDWSKENGELSLKKLQNFFHQKKDVFLKVYKPHALINIPEEFFSTSPEKLKAQVWIQCVVEIDNLVNTSQRKSLDKYYTCSVLL